MEKKTIKVEGMSCQHCVKAVTDALSGISGLEKVKVDLKSGSASFNYDPAKAGMDRIKSAVEGAGFTAII